MLQRIKIVVLFTLRFKVHLIDGSHPMNSNSVQFLMPIENFNFLQNKNFAQSLTTKVASVDFRTMQFFLAAMMQISAGIRFQSRVTSKHFMF